MDSQSTRKIIVASGMAVVVGISVVAFALTSHHSPSAAQLSPAQDSLAPTPAAPAAVVPAPDAPAAPAIAQVPAAPAAAAPIPDAPAVAQPKAARNRHLAKASTSADTTTRVVPLAKPTVEKPAGETPVQSVDGVKSADEVTTPSVPSGTTTGAQEGSASTEPAAPDAGSPPK